MLNAEEVTIDFSKKWEEEKEIQEINSEDTENENGADLNLELDKIEKMYR